MVQRVSIQFIDDLDGESKAHKTVRFAFDGAEYELDLSDQHVSEFRAAVEPYLRAARRLP